LLQEKGRIMVHSQAITREVLEGFVRPTFAAGAVLWRKSGEHHEIAVAHRPFYDDWSLPKGKLDPGESLPVTAAREILEETGYTAHWARCWGTSVTR
jgi:hydrolase, NUDIX family